MQIMVITRLWINQANSYQEKVHDKKSCMPKVIVRANRAATETMPILGLPAPVVKLLATYTPHSTMSMAEYKRKRDARRQRVLDKYEIIGFISSGTYGRVYKARSRDK